VKICRQIYSNIDIKHIIKEQYDILNKININTHIIVSVSGGVDSLCMFTYIKTNFTRK